jgi:hypothetical protein
MQYKQMQEQLEPMQKRLREKEQESRMLDLKVKEHMRKVA